MRIIAWARLSVYPSTCVHVHERVRVRVCVCDLGVWSDTNRGPLGYPLDMQHSPILGTAVGHGGVGVAEAPAVNQHLRYTQTSVYKLKLKVTRHTYFTPS